MNSLLSEILKFVQDRDWDKFHNPKDLAISISIEANELLECFQWKNSTDSSNINIESICDEISDVYIYLLLLCNKLDLNIDEITHNKLIKNNAKYSVEKCSGISTKYTEL